MARNLYDMGDQRTQSGDSWMHDQQERRGRVVPIGLLLVTLAGGLFALASLRFAGPQVQDGAPDPSLPTTISERFSLCDDPAGDACILSPGRYAYHGNSYRLADISVPSLADPRCPAEKALATEGRAALLALMNGGPLEARPDPAETDWSARLLIRDGVSLGSVMALKGYARPWSVKPIDWCAAG